MNKIYTVSEISAILANTINNNPYLNGISIEGEISNLSIARGYYNYFDLKQNQDIIHCMISKNNVFLRNFILKDGLKIKILCNANYYAPNSRITFLINKIEESGIGDLYNQYLQLKNKLYGEGYFNSKNKYLNPYPTKIAVLTGENSAALSDVLKQFKLRWPICKVDIYPCPVQGNEIFKYINSILLKVDNLDYDAILLTRGGGSFEDLFGFNNEELIKMIFSLKTYCVCAIGHEKDETLAELASDHRCSTPTQAVEYLTPFYDDVKNNVQELRKALQILLNNKVSNNLIKLASCNKDLSLFKNKLELQKQNIINYQNKLINNLYNKISQYANKINLNKNSLIYSYKNFINKNSDNISKNKNLLTFKMQYKYKENANFIKRLSTLLVAYSKENILSKGYSIVMCDNIIINNIDNINLDDELDIHMINGSLKVKVKEKKYE